MRYVKGNISNFTDHLKNKLCKKIDNFEKFIRDVGMDTPRTAKSWVFLYKEWTNIGLTTDDEEIKTATYLVMRAASRVIEETDIQPHTALSELRESLENLTKAYKQ